MVLFKDLYLTKGIRTIFGSLVYKDLIPDADEPMVQRLKAVGAIVVGKTNTPEFGLAVLTENKLGGCLSQSGGYDTLRVFLPRLTHRAPNSWQVGR